MASRRSCRLALLLPMLPALSAADAAVGTTVAQRMDAVLEHLLLESQQLATQDLPKEGLDEMDNVVLRLEECLAKLQDIQGHLISQVESHGAFANVTGVGIPQPINDMASRVSREIQPFIVVGLVCVTVALLKGRRPLDLFSVDIYSPWEAALAFTLSSFTGLVLVNQWVLSFLPDNPFTLYFSELAMCFLAVTTCVPLLMGASKFSTRWQASASLVAVICFGALCLADEISRVVFFFVVKESRSSSENYSLVLVPCLVVVTLYVGLLLTSLLKVLYRWGLTWRCVEPYGVGLLRNCKTYVASRLAGRASASELPVPLPAAVLVQVAGVGSFMAMLVLQMGYLGYVRYHELRLLAVALLRPIEPLFKLAGAPLPTDALDFAMPRIIISYYLALGCGACYEIWLMFTVLRGYRRMFADLAMGRRYHGQELVKSAGPGIFHAQWATYCCGALIGNAAMALVLLMFILWLLFLVLSLPQFWQMMWGFRKWWIVYGLTYATRWSIFRFVIPQKVVTDDGSVVRRRVWDLVFPTLTLLNFVLGATSGVIRSVVIAPYLLIHFFRIDITYLPSDLCDWDWSFQPFVSLVLHSYRRLNPILLATVAELGKSAQDAQRPPSQEEQELGTVDAVDLTLPPSSSELTHEVPQRARTTPGPHSRRARQRWQLAVILARNPSLRRLRKTGGYTLRAESAPACLGTEVDTLMPLRLPGLPRRLESSSTSFWSPLSRAVGARTPLLSEPAPVFPPEEVGDQP